MVNYRSWLVSVLCFSVLSTLCYSADSKKPSPDVKAWARDVIYCNGDTRTRLRNAWVWPIGFWAVSLGLLATAGRLYCNNKKRRSLLRKSMSAVRETSQQLGTDRASRARRKTQRWLIVSSLACFLAGMVPGISAIKLHRKISEAKRVMMYSV
jgi:hypothetical protein